MGPGGADVQHGHQIGSLAGGGEQGAHAPFQGGNFFLYNIVGGVGQAGVEEAVLLQVEEGAHLLGALVDVCGALHNGGHTGLPVFRLIARMDAKGIQLIVFHKCIFLSTSFKFVRNRLLCWKGRLPDARLFQNRLFSQLAAASAPNTTSMTTSRNARTETVCTRILFFRGIS